MLRQSAYRLWKASEAASLEPTTLAQATLRSVPVLEKILASSRVGRHFSTGADDEEERTITNPKVLALAEQITQLNLLEVSDLTEILRKKLNIQMPAGGMAFSMPQGAPMAAAAPGGKQSIHCISEAPSKPLTSL